MKKILFILNYRAGTHLWLFTNGSKSCLFSNIKDRNKKNFKPLTNQNAEGTVITKEWTGSNSSFWLPTIPKKICPCENYFSLSPEQINDNLPFSHFALNVHIGNWWGEVDSHLEVPEPYDIDTPVKFAAQDLLSLPGKQEDWKFIYIMRDGRNQLESLRNFPGGIEEQYHKKDPVNYFQVLCKTYRNKARLALDCQKQLPNFKIIKFEDLTSNCLDTTKEIYKFIDLPLDEEFVTHAYNLTISSKRDKKHSSFKDKDYHNRWKSWNNWEINTFKNIAGNELEEMNYKW